MSSNKRRSSSILSKAQGVYSKYRYGTDNPVTTSHFYGLADTLIDGTPVKMDRYKGSVLCVVNVASKCGLTTKNYTQLTSLVDEYGPQGFKVLAFPCNQFGGQEPGTPEEILKFVERYGARDKLTFFEKADVNGAEAREVFSFLKDKLPNDDGSTNILWNFGKFLVDHEGVPVKRFGSKTEPNAMREDIEELLKKREEGAAE